MQGGTFKNDAVLKAFEDYIGREVQRPPLSGEMGAYGIALLCREHLRLSGDSSRAASIINRDSLRDLRFTTAANDRCDRCANSCARTIVTFSHGASHITGNRCERGAEIEGTKERSPHQRHDRQLPDLLSERYRLLFFSPERRPHGQGAPGEKVIGIPRVLDFYDSYPFWHSFFRQLGFTVVLSDESSYPLFESGLRTVPSDTVCLPAKLAHGHIENLLGKGVSTIFMPLMLKNMKENRTQDDSWYCAVLQGYPEVIRLNGCIPPDRGVRFLTPAFKLVDRHVANRQIVRFAEETLGTPRGQALRAIGRAEREQVLFRRALEQRGAKVLSDLRGTGNFGVVIAGRPYHADLFVNHRVSGFFTRSGIPVLVNESLPGLERVDLSFSRIDTINTFHNRMLASAKFVAGHPDLEMVQLVSFGCGHDAILTDELNRILRSFGGKELLTLKLDEGENSGPLNIRITSFIETVRTQRRRRSAPERLPEPRPFPIRFEKRDRRRRTFLVPNLTWGFSMLMTNAFERQGYSTRILPVAGREAIAIGKRYVNNDICYPAQINIGEILHYLIEHPEQAGTSAAALAKNCNDCRACHYAALCRKALDDAGFTSVPIVTTAESDRRDMHPGLQLNRLKFNMDVLHGIVLIDALDEMARQCRPYELVKGQTDAVYDERVRRVFAAFSRSWRGALDELDDAIDAFNGIAVNRAKRKPRVGIIGEILVNFHDAGNHRIVQYLEEHGMEVVLPNLIEFWHQDAVNYRVAAEQGHVHFRWAMKRFAVLYESVFARIIRSVERRKKRFRFYQEHGEIGKIAAKAGGIFHPAFRTGEGWLIPGEIVNWIDDGIRSFLIVQPFGCLPNHISGKGVIREIKAKYPHVQILTLDFDPDTSLANVHNRLQMIILGAAATED